MYTGIKAFMGSVEINTKNFPHILKPELCLGFANDLWRIIFFS